MLRRIKRHSAVWLLVGLFIGFGAAAVFQVTPSYAVATDHSDEFAIATGHLTTELEAVYLLDFKSGSLLGTVMSRQTGEFQQFYRRELGTDFALNPRQKPKFIMVTGAMQSARAQVPVNHVLYVAELNSGKLGAYFMPYRGEVQRGTISEQLQMLGQIPFRSPAGRAGVGLQGAGQNQ
jgi:hypothetical protein